MGMWGLGISGALLMALSAFFLFTSARALAEWSRSGSWHSAETTVLRSAVQEGGRMRDADGAEGGMMYRIDLSYEYTAVGQRFTGTRLNFGPVRLYRSRSTAERALSRVGSAPRAWYNPVRPGDSVLERSPDAAWQVTVGVAAAAIGASLLFHIWSSKARVFPSVRHNLSEIL